jgi:hypothetical protein
MVTPIDNLEDGCGFSTHWNGDRIADQHFKTGTHEVLKNRMVF